MHLAIAVSSTLLFNMIYLVRCFMEDFEKIRGISIENAKLYVPGKDFTCLDGTLTIPYSYINDDYCDCLDASDEPGTSACSNGTFYCTNAGYQPLIVPSSRVNDGICDCCDGSDEWTNNVRKDVCQNTCEELGHDAEVEAKRIENLYAHGFKIREQLIIEGKHLVTQRQNKMSQLLAKKKDAQLIRSNTLNDKKLAEVKERKAIEKEKFRQQSDALKMFSVIDANKNMNIEVEEVIAQDIFDQNNDDFVSQDEIDYIMEGKKVLNLQDFMSNGWKRIKLMSFPTSNGVKHHTANLNVKNEDLNQDNEFHVTNKTRQYNVDSVRIDELFYSEKTKILIDESKKVSKLFEEADSKVNDIQKEINELEKLNRNLGYENEFAVLDRQCYEFINHEYIYKLCLFEKVTQRPIKGGPEVNLGVWKYWTSFTYDEPKFHTMLYDRGQYCSGNFQRFTYVHLSCGLEPKLISVTEPNRCEYSMEFEVPSVCVMEDAKYTREFKREEL